MNFPSVIDKRKEYAFQQFLDMYNLKEFGDTVEEGVITTNCFKHLFDNALKDNEASFQMVGDELINIHLKNEIPYVVTINEISFLKNKLIHILLDLKLSDVVIEVCNRFDKLEGRVSHCYLDHDIQSLQENIDLRLESLSDLAEDEIIHYYEAHVKWLHNLSEAIRKRDPKLVPEKDPTQCQFGKWLLKDAKEVIANDEKYQKIVQLHQTLHLLGHKIANLLNNFDESSHICATYLEKTDLTSMEIGIELMLVDNKRMIAKAAKDCLTEVLNRSVLESIFHNQYEIALATHSSFVFAMCDLDHFKHINDQFGHVVGDIVLKAFAKLLKDSLRASDIIVRFGGEEFVLILPAIDYQQGKGILKKVCSKVQHTPIPFQNQNIDLTVSIGIIEVFPQFHLDQSDEVSYSNFLRQADQKLYLAKDNGRNRVE